MSRIAILALGLSLAVTSCAPVAGDACTTQKDCGEQVCLNVTYTPDGYCTQQCSLTPSDSCPAGSVCVRDAISKDLNGCLRTCETAKDCRSGYECRKARESSETVCVGREGI